MAKFIQIHFLSTYSASLLNRDDAGLAKRIPFGGSTRTRISSQCQKRHWRTFDGKGSLQEVLPNNPSFRSRLTFQKHLVDPLLEDGHPSKIVDIIAKTIVGEIAKIDDSNQKSLATKQLTVLGKVEMDHLQSIASRIIQTISENEITKEADIKKETKDFLKSQKSNLTSLVGQAGLSGAMFGRMVTSDILARVDAAVHVAHAFTVHSQDAETDYFTAVDDLLGDNETGSGHINQTDLNSGLFYGYAVIDVDLLKENLSGDSETDKLAAQLSTNLLQIICTISPGAKKGSTAPYSLAEFVLLEAGNTQPRSLAGAFLKPVSKRNDLLGNTYQAIGNYLEDMDGFYGKEVDRVVFGRGLKEEQKTQMQASTQNLINMKQWLSKHIQG